VRFYRNNDIEERAALRLSQLEQMLGRPLTPPIPIDRLAEDILELDFLWEPIEQMPGETILGAISPETRRIILNETHRALFEQKQGLERSTKGHEMGHWDLYLSANVDHPRLFDSIDSTLVAYRNSATREVMVIKALIASPEGQELVRTLHSRADHPDEARAVNRYAAALSMPKVLICNEALKIDRTQWRNLYGLAEKFDVTITALRVRLEQLDLLHISKDGTLYGSPEEATGQRSLF
jgi:hypothetical protein